MTHTCFVLLQTYQRFCLLLLLFFCFVFKGHFNIWFFHIRLFWRRRLFPLCLLCVSYLDFVSCSASFCVTMQVFVCLLMEGLLCHCICHWCVVVFMMSWNDKLKTEYAQKQLFIPVSWHFYWQGDKPKVYELREDMLNPLHLLCMNYCVDISIEKCVFFNVIKQRPLGSLWIIQWKIWQTV